MSEQLKATQDVLTQRRKFLTGFGLLSATALAGGAALTGLRAGAAESQADTFPAWPWPYSELDPARSAEIGHAAYYEGACCYGGFKAIIANLAEVHGFPYTVFPMDMMRFGSGGVVGWGTICGTLNGAGAAINLVCPNADATKLIGELMAWYTQTALPIYVPSGQDATVRSVSDSPLCHASVSKWCAASQQTVSSAARKERCARLVADVGAKATQLLNDYFKQQFVVQYQPAPIVAACMSCHGSTAMDDTLGKMNCTSCHAPHNVTMTPTATPSPMPTATPTMQPLSNDHTGLFGIAEDWRKSGYHGPCDLCPDGQVDESDLLKLMESWHK